MKHKLGALVLDGPRLIRCLATCNGWCRMRNRYDQFGKAPVGIGMRCEWIYSRTLHICDMFPVTGRWLLQRALRQWPVGLDKRAAPIRDGKPCVSFIIGHRGLDRLPHLLMTLRSIHQQQNLAVECIVVEQDSTPSIQNRLPDWVRYLHAPLHGSEMRYGRAAAFNAGSRLAHGEMLVLHDSDILLPLSFADEVWRVHQMGYEAIRLGRFFFYLAQMSTDRLLDRSIEISDASVDSVIENAVGGCTAISRSVFIELGGMDEDFVGWGGEDNEFWDRCLTRKVWEYGYLPLVHLWHPSLANRQRSNPTLSLLAQKRKTSALDRVAALRVLREKKATPGHQEGSPLCC